MVVTTNKFDFDSPIIIEKFDGNVWTKLTNKLNYILNHKNELYNVYIVIDTSKGCRRFDKIEKAIEFANKFDYTIINEIHLDWTNHDTYIFEVVK